MEMNFRKPSWRCPCCNTPTSGIDLRIDQNIVKASTLNINQQWHQLHIKLHDVLSLLPGTARGRGGYC